MEITFNELPAAVSKIGQRLARIEDLLLKNPAPTKENPELLTIEQAAEYLHLSVPTLYSKVSRRELPYMKRSKRLYFDKEELRIYIKEGRKKTRQEQKDEVKGVVK